MEKGVGVGVGVVARVGSRWGVADGEAQAIKVINVRKMCTRFDRRVQRRCGEMHPEASGQVLRLRWPMVRLFYPP